MSASLAAGQFDCLEPLLDRVRRVLAYDYAQWVLEAPQSRDYNVFASRFPPGQSCYEVAHRPGVIGQVFRRRRPIFLQGARLHPLYDPYDDSIEWELALPLFEEDALAGVLNLEGGSDFELSEFLWQELRELLSSGTGWYLPEAIPKAGETWMTRTNRADIRGEDELSTMEAAFNLGRAAAAGGACVIVVGALGLPTSSVYPAVSESLASGAPLSGCVRGGDRRLDLLPVQAEERAAFESTNWWDVIDGRYDFAITGLVCA